MKNSALIFSGLVILGISMIISSMIFSKGLTTQEHIINGSLGVNQSIHENNYGNESEYLPIGEVSALLGYENVDEFTKDVLNEKLGNIPYVKVNENLIFSRTAFEEWLVFSAELKKKF